MSAAFSFHGVAHRSRRFARCAARLRRGPDSTRKSHTMKTQRVNLFASSPCVRCGQPVGSCHLVVAVVGPGRRRRFCGAGCLFAWSAGVVRARRARPPGVQPDTRYQLANLTGYFYRVKIRNHRQGATPCAATGYKTGTGVQAGHHKNYNPQSPRGAHAPLDSGLITNGGSTA